MTKTRVEPLKTYWFVTSNATGTTFYADWERDIDTTANIKHFESGNYFHTKEEAEQTARKLRAVLKGADVVENQDYDTVLNDMRQLILAQCKEWLETNIANQVEMMCAEGPLMMSKTTFLADFEAEMLKLWEEKK